MPSKTPKQARFMRMHAAGERCRRCKGKPKPCVPKSVAEEFVEADQAKARKSSRRKHK